MIRKDRLIQRAAITSSSERRKFFFFWKYWSIIGLRSADSTNVQLSKLWGKLCLLALRARSFL